MLHKACYSLELRVTISPRVLPLGFMGIIPSSYGVLGHKGWSGAAPVPCPGTACRHLHHDICPFLPQLYQDSRSNAPCSHSPHFYLRVSIIHSSAWRWVEIGATSQGPPLPTSTLYWSATFPLPLIGLFIRAFAYLILILTNLGPMTGPKILKQKRINFFVFCHCAVSSLLSKIMKAEALADWMSKGHWVQGQNTKQTHKKLRGWVFKKILLTLMLQHHGLTEVQRESGGHKLVNQTKSADD